MRHSVSPTDVSSRKVPYPAVHSRQGYTGGSTSVAIASQHAHYLSANTNVNAFQQTATATANIGGSAEWPMWSNHCSQETLLQSLAQGETQAHSQAQIWYDSRAHEQLQHFSYDFQPSAHVVVDSSLRTYDPHNMSEEGRRRF